MVNLLERVSIRIGRPARLSRSQRFALMLVAGYSTAGRGHGHAHRLRARHADCRHVVRRHRAARAGARDDAGAAAHADGIDRSEEHTSELQSLMRTTYAVFCLKKKTT